MTRREAIIQLHCAGRINSEIIKLLKVAKSNVYHVVNRFKELGTQQDGAPSHTSRKTQHWCQRHFPRFWSKEIWPLASPDLNPMDFSVWSLLEVP